MIADKNNISSQFKENIEFLKKNNPDWEYRLFDDEDIVAYLRDNFHPKILGYYQRINPKYGAARSYFFRYLLMYMEGGVYFDIKSAAKFPLNKILLPDDEYILSVWDVPLQFTKLNNTFGEFQQWHIICRPRHPFLYEVINQVIKNIDSYTIKVGVGKPAVLEVTGPIAYTQAISPILHKYIHRIVEINDSIGLTYNNLKNTSHKNLFSKTHYSKITEPVILHP
jgi:mannosyltransferase OCH1-like enzyme